MEMKIDTDTPQIRLYPDSLAKIHEVLTIENEKSIYFCGNVSLKVGKKTIPLPMGDPTIDFTLVQLISTPWYYNGRTNFRNLAKKINNMKNLYSKSDTINYAFNITGGLLSRFLDAYDSLKKIDEDISPSDLVNFLALNYCSSICKLLLKRENYAYSNRAYLPDVCAKQITTSPDEINKEDYTNISIYTDGASRGNPGKSAVAWMIIAGGQIIEADSDIIGDGTNNNAEYRAILSAIDRVKLFCNPTETTLHFYTDSQLVVRQLTGWYGVNSCHLAHLHRKVIGELDCFKEVHIQHLYRENDNIRYCDSLCNQTLNCGLLDRLKEICSLS